MVIKMVEIKIRLIPFPVQRGGGSTGLGHCCTRLLQLRYKQLTNAQNVSKPMLHCMQCFKAKKKPVNE